YCQAASRYPTTKPASLKASWKKPSRAAAVTENTRNPRMIQSAMLMVQRSSFNDRSMIRSATIEFNDTSARGLNLQLASRQLTVCPEVLFACPQRNFLG